MIKRILALLFIASSAFAQVPGTTQTKLVNPILLNDLNANGKKIINADLSNIILPASQITGTISGGGGGTGVNSLVLAAPSPLLNNVTFSIGSLGDITGALTLQAAPAHTIFGNVSSSASNPNYMTVNDLKNMIAVNNVDNTSDLNKPISTAMQAALDAGLAAKQNSLGVPSTNGYLVTANTDGSTGFVDPASVGPAFGAAPANTFFGNGTGSAVQPAFMSVNTAKSSLALNNVENTAISTWPGSANVTTLGTITTGVWNGTAIGASFLPALNAITAPAADVSLNSHKITNLADPSNALDATNKQYVDSVANAGPPHAVVVTASTANLTLLGEQTIDGVLTSASRVLVKNQTTAADNGIYVTAAGAWARATDADTGLEVSGIVFVSGGTVNAGSTWGVTTPQPITLGSTSIAYTLTGQGSTYTAGSGINLSGSQFSLAPMAANSIKGNNTGSSASPIDLSASQAKSLLSLNLVENTALSTWAGSGNITTLGTITAGTVPIARLGGVSTVGASLLAIPDPNALRYIRIKTDNTIEVLTNTAFVSGVGAEPAFGNPSINGQVISSTTSGTRSFVSKENPLAFSGPLARSGDTVSIPQASSSVSGYISNTDYSLFLGKEAGLTFNSPLARSVNTISIPQANGSTAGYIDPTTWNAFNNKVPPGRTLVGTPPITIGGTTSGDLSVDRAIGITQATSTTNGYITSNDYLKFPSSVSGIRLGAGVGSSDTAAAANFDYKKDTIQVGTNLNATWNAGVTNFVESQALTAPRTRTLPAASGFVDGSTIHYMDSITTGLFGPLFLPAGSDTLKGSNAVTWNAGYNPFVAAANGGGSKTITFQKKGTNWEVYAFGGENISIKSIRSNTNAAGSATFDDSDLTGARIIGIPDFDTQLFAPSDPNVADGVLLNANANGTFTRSALHETNIHSNAYVIGSPGVDILGGVIVVSPDDGSIDKVVISGNITGPYTIRLPSSTGYQPWQELTIIDASGSISPARPVTITADNGSDMFSGQSAFTFDEPNGRRVLTTDDNGNWNVTTVKTSIQPFAVVQPTGNQFVISGNVSAVKHNATLNLQSGANLLVVDNRYDGMEIDLTLVQPSGGDATLSLPSVSKVSGNSAGAITLTAANGAIDQLHGRYNGALSAFLWDKPLLNYTSIAVPTAPSSLATGTITSGSVVLNWTDNSSNESGFALERANGLSQTTGFTSVNTSIAANATTYTDSSVAPNTDYTYRIKAFNAGGSSSYSTTVNAHTLSGVTADIFEVHFNEGTGNSQAADTVPSGQHVNLVYSTDWTTSTENSTGAALALTPGMGQTQNVLVTPHTAGTTSYTYKVVGYKNTTLLHNAAGQGSTTTGTAILTATDYNTISWSAVSGADFYRVFRSASGGTPTGVGQVSGDIPSGTLTFVDTGIAAGSPVPGVATDVHTATSAASLSYGTSQVLSVSFWVRSSLSGSTVLNMIDGTSFSIKQAPSNKLQMSFTGSNGLPLTGQVPTTTFNDNSWHSIVVELDNTTLGNTAANIKVYVDGSSTALTTTLTVTTRSGAANFASSQPVIGGQWTGSIDDVRIYGRLLNTSEISNIFTGHAQ